ncbi:metal ABC transporter permease [Geobacter sp. SVR]|uniref:metal ABC transporter permease n=1 Tax=Geobacter sp. SVR TaxID=2495594 RepID=UPI00143EF4AC|nr:metal ABC transporter permease [Geobacter sp. SVR]BCS53748.1 ABC transporter [Geobacter sp. SVR]GCF85743.1 ABC transporter [Geobacter sp. SVR]
MSLTEILSYGFIQRALLAGTLIALLCSVLGVFLVLRRLSLIGDGLAHVTFGSTAIALAMKLYSASSLLVSLPVVLLSSLGILKLTEKARLNGDAAIGIVSALGISAGIILASVGGGYNVDLLSYLFGNILSISRAEVFIAAGLSCMVMVLLSLFYHELLAITFSEELAATSGIRSNVINAVLVLLTALSVVLAMKLVGIMLISSLLILPAASALQLARSFRACLLLAALQGCCSVVAGIFVSFVTNLPTSATVVMINLVCFGSAFLARRLLSPAGSN